MKTLLDVLSSLIFFVTFSIASSAQTADSTNGEVWILGSIPLQRLGIGIMDTGNTTVGIYAGIPLSDRSVFSLFVGYDRALGTVQYQPENAISLNIRFQSSGNRRSAEFGMLGVGTGISTPEAKSITTPLVQFAFGESLRLYDKHRILVLFRLQSFIGVRTLGQFAIGYSYTL
ncbi:MAG: hypothetical protein JNL32_02840 [Candidatus Kapabacteria bacterium]|nr:hypothetical protein [Candidatus Kapabacteria bacterium]